MLNEMLGIKYPIIQGGMANIATGKFAAAVSNAGGLGLIATGGLDAAKLEKEIADARKSTDKPFGVNLMLMNPDADNIADLLYREKISVITTGAGMPGKYMDKWKEAGAKVMPVVASTALDGRQFAAALSLGAIGIQIGTCLLVSEECPIHDNYKQALIKAKDNSTVVTGRSLDAPVRILKNKMARDYLKLEKNAASRDELEQITLGGLRRAVFDGDMNTGSVMTGQVCGQLKEIKTVAEILDGLMDGARKELDRLKNISL